MWEAGDRVLRRHWFGGLTPACGRHAKQAVSVEDASAALGVPVAFSTEEPVPTPRFARLRFVLVQLVVPIAILLLGIGGALMTRSGVPLNFAELGVLGWLLAGPAVFDRIAPRFGLGRRETVRLQRRWNWLVLCVVVSVRCVHHGRCRGRVEHDDGLTSWPPPFVELRASLVVRTATRGGSRTAALRAVRPSGPKRDGPVARRGPTPNRRRP